MADAMIFGELLCVFSLAAADVQKTANFNSIVS